jgi:methyl-accepting chemotaxis protein
MDGIRELSSKVTSLIRNLSVSMENIENVLKLIVDINDQIGLLALNAAIIAAQAGGRGYGFTVVAEEMKALSERTEKSAKEIAKMVAGIQKEAKGTLKVVNETEAQVDQSYLLSRKAGDVILSIQRGVHEANQRMTEIARASVEQAQMGSSVSQAAQELSTAIERLASASQEQASSSAHLLREAQNMKEVAEGVDHSVGNQARESREIDQRMKEVNAAMAQVWQATDAQLQGIGAVMDTVSAVNQISERNGFAARQLGEVMNTLRDRADSLRRETDRFTLEKSDETGT